MRVTGASLDELDRLGDEFSTVVINELHALADEVARELQDPVTVEDLSGMTAHWDEHLDLLVSQLFGSWLFGVTDLRDQLLTTRGITAAADDPPTFYNFVPPAAELGQLYLSQRRNYLRGIGNEYWEDARASLLEGLQADEGIPQLQERVRTAAKVTEARAEMIARTEVVGASNAGQYMQAQALGMQGEKEWVATRDERTRPTHRWADGQKQPLYEPFIIGRTYMDRPHAPGAPAHEIIRCRCTLAFHFRDEDVQDLGTSCSDVTVPLPVDNPPPLPAHRPSSLPSRLPSLPPQLRPRPPREITAAFWPRDARPPEELCTIAHGEELECARALNAGRQPPAGSVWQDLFSAIAAWVGAYENTEYDVYRDAGQRPPDVRLPASDFHAQLRNAYTDALEDTAGARFLRTVMGAPRTQQVLSRGMSVKTTDGLPNVGETFRLGVSSFTANDDIAYEFAGSSPTSPVEVHIALRPGARALNLTDHMGTLDYAQEWVAGGDFRVVDRRERQERGHPFVHLLIEAIT